MSGPDINRLVGGVQIGEFSIGVSPVGTVPPFDVWQTIVSQYANSPVLTAMILNFFGCLDQTKMFDGFYDMIRNVDTAEGYGLDLWGRIVAINRILTIAVGPKYFGFDEGYPDYEGWDQAPFYSGEKLTENYVVSDDGFRVMILAKAFSNICDGSILSINRLLRMLFGTSGRCYCTDGLDMTMTYTFEFALSPLQYAIVTQSGVLPRPTGVRATVAEI